MNLAARLNLDRGSSSPARSSADKLPDQLFESLYSDVVDRLNTKVASELSREQLFARVLAVVEETLELRGIALSAKRQDRIVEAITDEMAGLGPIEALCADSTVSDILVNGWDKVYVERDGVLQQTDIRFRDDEHLIHTIRRIVARLGRRIDEASPMVDARLEDGSRVNAIIPPLAIDGPVLSIRRFVCGPKSFKDLHRSNTLSAAMSHYFKSAVRSGANILVCGGTGAGKTTLLNALSTYIPSRQRVVTIEDAAELQLQQTHVVRLEARPANIEGKGGVTIRDLVRNALRMRPDRIIVGEVRSDEVLDMVQAMNTGHEGSMTTVHANGIEDAITRLVAMMSMAGTPLSEALMLQMVSRAIHVIVHVSRTANGKRRICEVSEVSGALEGGAVALHPVFRLAEDGRWLSAKMTKLEQRFRDAEMALPKNVLRGDL